MINFNSTDAKIRLSTCSTTCTLYSTILSISTTSTKSRRLVTATFASLGYHIETETSMPGKWISEKALSNHYLQTRRANVAATDQRTGRFPYTPLAYWTNQHKNRNSLRYEELSNRRDRKFPLFVFKKKRSFETLKIGSKILFKVLRRKGIVSFDEMVLHPKSAWTSSIVGC